MRLILQALLGASMMAAPAVAMEPGWMLRAATSDLGEQFIYESGSQISYQFLCEADAIAITETGVTDLLDLRTNVKIGDGPDAHMPEGAALMALFGGKGTPDFRPATAIKNPSGGWDLTIRLKKSDKQLRAIGSSDMISLFTTGYTAAVAIDSTTKAKWKDFLKRCQSVT